MREPLATGFAARAHRGAHRRGLGAGALTLAGLTALGPTPDWSPLLAAGIVAAADRDLAAPGLGRRRAW